MRFGLRGGLLLIAAIAFLMWANLPVSRLTEDYDIGPPAEYDPVRSFLFMRGWPVPIWTKSWGDILGWHIKAWHFWGILALNTSIQILIAGGIILLPEWFVRIYKKEDSKGSRRPDPFSESRTDKSDK